MGSTITAHLSSPSELKFNVHILLGSDHYDFPCKSTQTVLSAAEEAGVPLPNSCGVGMCTTCAAKLSEGKVELGEGSVCAPECHQKGFILLCVAYPRSNLKFVAGLEEELFSLGDPYG